MTNTKSTTLKQSSLKKIRSDLKWVDPYKSSHPMSQGLALKELITRYKIPAKKVGYSGASSYIGIETNKQFLFWRDDGVSLTFKGIINKNT